MLLRRQARARQRYALPDGPLFARALAALGRRSANCSRRARATAAGPASCWPSSRPGKPLLWVQERMAILEAGRLHPPGLPSQNLIHVEARDARDALWAMEEGLRCPALCAVIGEFWGDPAALDFTATRAVGTTNNMGTVRPDPELVDGRGTERVGGRQDDRAPLGGIAARELADRRRLAGPVDPDDEHDRRTAADRRAQAPRQVARDQERGQLRADGRFGTARVAARIGRARRGRSRAPPRHRRRSASPRRRPTMGHRFRRSREIRGAGT